jgi:NADPH:quinone reductase
MKAVVCSNFGNIDDLKISTMPIKDLGPNDVRIEVKAASLNFMDPLMVQGLYQVKPNLPFVPGACGAGEVIETGTAVIDIAPGNRVSWIGYTGAFAEQAVVNRSTVTKLPDYIDWQQGACWQLSFSPAYISLVHSAGIKPGETLLVNGAAGGVGLAAVKLGKFLGAKVIGAVGSAAKIAAVKSAGAEEVIDYSQPDFKDRVLACTDSQGADVVLDTVGGDLLEQCLRCTNSLGRIITVGYTSGVIPKIPANLLLLKNLTVTGMFAGSLMAKHPRLVRQLNSDLLAKMADQSLRDRIDSVLPLDSVVQGMRQLLAREVIGKLVFSV